MRYQFIDKINELDKDKKIVTVKAISICEDWAEHHFPGFPIFPGALQIETMAQAAGALLEISNEYRISTLLLMTEKVKFKKMLHPGDVMIVTAEITDLQETFATSEVRIECEGKLMSIGKIVSGIRIHPEETAAEETERQRKHYRFLLRNTILFSPENS